MKTRPWTKRLVFLAMAAILPACGGEHNNSATTGVGSDSPSGAITDFIGGAFENWGQAQFLTAIGLMPTPSTTEQLNQVLSDLGQVQQQLSAAQADLQTLMGDFINLQEQMSQDDFTAQAELLQSITSAEYANWNQFTNAVGDQTLAEVAANPLSTGALVGLLTDPFLNTLATQASELSNTAAAGDELNSTVPDYLISATNLLTSKMASLQSQTQNVVPLFDQYNNGLMNQYYYLVQALQQIYTIEQTVLYLQDTTSSFDDITLAEPGILDSNTYDQNYAALNALFDARLTQLCTLFNAAIVSDGAPPITCGTTPAPPTTAAKTLPGVVGGAWTAGETCNLYVWLGAVPSPQTDFEGSWDGSALTAQCDGASYDLSLSSCGSAAQQLSFYSGPDAGGTQTAQLQCGTLNGHDFSAPGWSGSAGDMFAADWANDQASHSQMCVNVNGFGPTLPYTAPISGPLTGSGSYCTNIGSLPGVSFSSVWQYSAPSGFVGAFALLGTDPVQKGGFGITVQVLCLSGDPWCAQLPGQSSNGNLQNGSSSICIAHEKLTLQAGGGTDAEIVYTNQSC